MDFKFKETEVHSPLAFLTYAIAEVLKQANEVEADRLILEDQARQKKQLNEKADQELKQFQTESLAIFAEFEACFPDEVSRSEVVKDLTGKLSFKDSAARSKYAARRWWIEREAKA